MLNEDQRRSVMLGTEGQVLQSAAGGQPEVAAEIARAIMDGAVNALIRLEGMRATAEFTLLLADRAVGGLIKPTDYAPFEPPAPMKPKPVPWREKADYPWGIVHGVLLALIVLVWMGRL